MSARTILVSLTATFIITLFMLTGPLCAQDGSDMESSDFTKSIGVNNLPWDATGVSFRWWKDDNNGRELILGTFRTTLAWIDDIPRNSAEFSGIQYYMLRREALDFDDGFYLVRGVGIGLGINTANEQLSDELEISTAVYFPVGIEHFFLNNYPNISYSIEANPSARLIYDYSYTRNDETEHSITLNLGVSPKFYIRVYFQ